MEHRLKNRCELSMDVVVRGRDGMVLQGRSEDISSDGIFIQLSRNTVQPRSIVGIELSQGIRLRGWVVHVEEEGIGVMFHSVDNREQHLLNKLLAEKCSSHTLSEQRCSRKPKA